VTDGPDETTDPVWDEAVTWLLRRQAAPDDAAVAAGLAQWIAASEAHARAYERAERVWQLAGELPPAHADRWAGTARGEAPSPVAAANPGTVARPRPTRRRVVLVALLVLGAWLAVLSASPALRRMTADHSTGIGESRRVTLADGSTLSLDAASAVNVRYGPSLREITLLAGETFVSVRPDRARPFQVRAGPVTVTSTGTAFDINLGDEAIAVAVAEGAVEIRRGDDAGAAISLARGEKIAIDRSTGAVARAAVTAGEVGAWQSGRLVVDDATVADVVDKLRRYHHGVIVLTDHALAARRIAGVYNLDNPAAALRASVEPHGGRVRELTPYMLLVTGR
jgi:transmembrane sensor